MNVDDVDGKNDLLLLWSDISKILLNIDRILVSLEERENYTQNDADEDVWKS